MGIRKAYYYLFYKLYVFNNDNSDWLREWKTGLFIDVFWFLISMSGIIYYTIFVDRHFELPNTAVVIILYVGLIALPNYFIFHHKDRWKNIVEEFDKLPRKKNIIGGWFVLFIVMLVIANLIFAFYLMSRIDWSLYR